MPVDSGPASSVASSHDSTPGLDSGPGSDPGGDYSGVHTPVKDGEPQSLADGFDDR